MSRNAEKCLHVLMAGEADGLDRAVMHIIKTTLQTGEPVRLHTTSKTEEVRAVIQNQEIHLCVALLTNLIAPGGASDPERRIWSGLELIREIKRMRRVPVIALSGYQPGPNFALEVLHAGADFFFPLPFNPRHFKQALFSLWGTG
jgi:CheY-like chemotaxis protein